MTSVASVPRFPLLAPCLVLALAATAAPPADLPEAEKALADTVDPWGLPFSDQLVRFRSHFAVALQAPFAVGTAHDLVKVLPTKYWFRGEVWPAGAADGTATERWAAAGETQAFQLAVLPRIGAPEAVYRVAVEAPGATVSIYREVFVKTSPAAAYPRPAGDRWPDPLLPENSVTVGGTDAGVFWVDVALPATAPAGVVACRISVEGGGAVARVTVPIRVVPGLDLDPKGYRFFSWFRRGKLTPDQYRDQCALVLDHHMIPADALRGQWDPANPQAFDDQRAFLAERGQRLFQVDGPEAKDFDSLYRHLRDQGWLESSVIYSNCDEPDEEQFRTQNVPFMKTMRAKYPGLRVFLASDWHEDMAAGCDAWMTDLSASGYDPEKHRGLKAPELWHYYCHLPIRWQMRAPLVDAPNMQIDNPALEHRLALWMSSWYGARAVFIWAGNAYTFADDFWQTLTLDGKLSPYPYAGVHNGNGWVVYPSPDGSGTVPSLRLKVIRDGLEDVALLQAAQRRIESGRVRGDQAAELKALLNPVPGVFVHPHYFDRRPEALLGRREAILSLCAGEGR
jgi:hypothetical protein